MGLGGGGAGWFVCVREKRGEVVLVISEESVGHGPKGGVFSVKGWGGWVGGASGYTKAMFSCGK